MKRIQELDAELSRVFTDFQDLALTLRFQEVCELCREEIVGEQQYPGIYKIDIHTGSSHSSFKEWYDWFHAEWVTPEYERMFVPNPKKKRVAAHIGKPLPEWMPLYIGKSRSIAGRVLEHLHLRLTQPTTALKLRERRNMSTQRFRLSTIRVDVSNYDIIMPKIESVLRNLHNPIIGRQ